MCCGFFLVRNVLIVCCFGQNSLIGKFHKLNNVNTCVDINELIQIDAFHTGSVSELKAAKEISFFVDSGGPCGQKWYEQH